MSALWGGYLMVRGETKVLTQAAGRFRREDNIRPPPHLTSWNSLVRTYQSPGSISDLSGHRNSSAGLPASGTSYAMYLGPTEVSGRSPGSARALLETKSVTLGDQVIWR